MTALSWIAEFPAPVIADAAAHQRREVATIQQMVGAADAPVTLDLVRALERFNARATQPLLQTIRTVIVRSAPFDKGQHNKNMKLFCEDPRLSLAWSGEEFPALLICHEQTKTLTEEELQQPDLLARRSAGTGEYDLECGTGAGQREQQRHVDGE